MEVKIVSREIIKPSIEIHDNQMETLELSILDQLSTPTYTSIALFYPNKQPENSLLDPESMASRLRISLSETLNHFRVLGGRMLDDGIDCNEQGVLFLEAEVRTKMEDFLSNPQLELLDLLLPFRANEVMEFSVQIAVQINKFSCGGLAVSVSFLHKLIDGATFSYFFKSWGSITKSLPKKLPDFDYRIITELFPPRETEASWIFEGCPFMAQGKTLIRRFVFDAEKISKLKAEAMSKTVPNPTSVEVITGWIWKFALKSARERFGEDSPSVLSHSVNFRSKMNPPLPENAIGNLFWITLAAKDKGKLAPSLGELVGIVRNSIQRIDGAFIQKMKGENGYDQILKFVEEAKETYFEKRCSYVFSSWRNMGLNEVDFGWGKPVWSSVGGFGKDFVRNLILLLDTRDGDGVQAWIVLDEEEMKILEKDEEFLAMASLNPPINLCR